MQTGFAMLEVGSVNKKNTRNILLKVRRLYLMTINVIFGRVCLNHSEQSKLVRP